MYASQKVKTRPLSADRESGYGSDIEVSPVIKSLERLSLEDDGKRDWHEESRNYLNEHYGEWKDLKTTVMVPPCLQLDPDPTGQETEKKVFDLLNEFGETNHEPMFVVHSYSFNELIHKLEDGYESKEWVKGEQDFVIIHRKYGVIFLEVKSKKKTKGVYKEGKRQIDKARNAILSYLKKRYGKSKKVDNASYAWPGFVVMPNCKKQVQTTPYGDVLYEEDCSSQEAFKQWWDDKIADPSKGLDQEVYEELVIRFVPFSCLLPTLNLQLDKTHENIVKIFTPRQLEAWYNSSPVQWFTGPAGSGKTVLLIEKVKEIASKIQETDENMDRILVLCFNVPLSIHLENEINGWFRTKYNTSSVTYSSPVTIKTYDAFIKEVGGFGDVTNKEDFNKRRKNVEESYKPQSEDQMYEHIFVDEGQDLSGDQWPKLLERLHHKPNIRSRYYFWVMFDSNQHVQLNDDDNLPWDYLRNASQLKYVFRNTKNIFSLSKKYYEDISGDGEIELGHKEPGMEVVWDKDLKQDRSNRAELVANHIGKLRKKRVKSRDITVLARTRKAAISLVDILSKTFKIRGVNAEERLKNGAQQNATVESIRRFKGLESKVVIVCDPKCYPSDDDSAEKTRQLIYTAVSRCFCYLIIVSTPDGCKRIKNVSTHIPTSPGISSLQEKRKNETSVEEFARLENEHKQGERHASFNPYGKRSRDNHYESGPPERKEFVDKTDKESSDDETIPTAVKIDPMEEKRIMRDYERKKKSKQLRPVNVAGSDLREPGDEFIEDQIRSKAFPMLEPAVKTNLSFTANNFIDENVKKCVAIIEYNIYQNHRAKRNSRDYTKTMRKLKRDIENDNREGKLNSEVKEALNQE